MAVQPAIPPTEKMEEGQVKNNAGAFVWGVDDLTRLRRYICLGCEDGTFYQGREEIGLENIQCLKNLIKQGRGYDVVDCITDYSVNGRTARQNAIIHILAYCTTQQQDHQTSNYAYTKLKDICRIPTHLFMFVELAELTCKGDKNLDSTGWGRARRRAICNWYNQFDKDSMRLATHVTKYKQRNNWSHTDVIRLAHPKPKSDQVGAVIRYVIKGLEASKLLYGNPALDKTFAFLKATEDVKKLEKDEQVAKMIEEYNLVREHIPTEFLNFKTVWKALLKKMPMTALIRNLGKMTKMEILDPGTEEAKHVVAKLTDEKALKYAKIHPYSILVAMKIYEAGKGDKGHLTWKPNPDIVGALDKAYYLSFKFVEPTGKRFCLAVDVSGSMDFSPVKGTSCITPKIAAAAMAMTTVRTEPNHTVVAFSSNLRECNVGKDWSLRQVTDFFDLIPMGGTNCAKPMTWATTNKLEFDVFIVYTDCETWSGATHPAQALQQYRTLMKVPEAKLIVCGMNSNGFTIADPEDPGMLDMVGFDSNAPDIISNFTLGYI